MENPGWRQHPLGHTIKHLPPNQHADYVGMRHDVSSLFSRRDVSYIVIEGRACAHHASYDVTGWVTMWWKTTHLAAYCSKLGVYDYGWPTVNLNLQSLTILQLIMSQFIKRIYFLKKSFLIMWVWDRRKRLMAFVKKATILPTFLFLKPTKDWFSLWSCFIVFFFAGLSQCEKCYNGFHASAFSRHADARPHAYHAHPFTRPHD